VRVLLVDTPELAGECYGQEAAQRTAELVPPGAKVLVQADRDPEDRYGRALLHVWDDAGGSLGLTLLDEGYATVLQVEPNRLHLEAFQAAERQARESGRGLWGACG
jgi:endonuclease YncB( thermonuclease family)